ncbi:MAG: class I SAM-dependent methyltransferase, partial [Flavobacteriales bacterium]|nr:class I SAM-dependent methyltransferase [Flavobacteriales bacterium]
NLDSSAKNLIDVGCGKGYFLSQLQGKGLELTGCDIVDKGESKNYNYVKGNIEKLPFKDNEFDIVTCFHTLEHIISPEKAISELKRIAKKQLIIAVPCQRYFYYTLDEHVNFYPFKEKLTSIIDIENNTCEKIWGDWVYIGVPTNND